MIEPFQVVLDFLHGDEVAALAKGLEEAPGAGALVRLLAQFPDVERRQDHRVGAPPGQAEAVPFGGEQAVNFCPLGLRKRRHVFPPSPE